MKGVAMIRGSGSARSALTRSPSCPGQNPKLNIPRSSKPEKASLMCKPATFHANGDAVQNGGYFTAHPYHPRHKPKHEARIPAQGQSGAAGCRCAAKNGRLDAFVGAVAWYESAELHSVTERFRYVLSSEQDLRRPE